MWRFAARSIPARSIPVRSTHARWSTTFTGTTLPPTATEAPPAMESRSTLVNPLSSINFPSGQYGTATATTEKTFIYWDVGNVQIPVVLKKHFSQVLNCLETMLGGLGLSNHYSLIMVCYPNSLPSGCVEQIQRFPHVSLYLLSGDRKAEKAYNHLDQLATLYQSQCPTGSSVFLISGALHFERMLKRFRRQGYVSYLVSIPESSNQLLAAQANHLVRWSDVIKKVAPLPVENVARGSSSGDEDWE